MWPVKKISTLFLLGIIFIGCAEEKKTDADSSISQLNSEVDLKKLEKKLSDSLFPATISQKGASGLLVNIKVPLPEIYYERKLNIIRERVVLLSIDEVRKVDSLWINFDVKESNGQPIMACYLSKQLEGVVQFNSTNKMYSDFNYYILKNLNGDKLASFSVYLKILKKLNPNATYTDDYIQLLYDYIDEKQNHRQGKTSENALITLKSIIIEGKEWKDFNPADIDFFLNYK